MWTDINSSFLLFVKLLTKSTFIKLNEQLITSESDALYSRILSNMVVSPNRQFLINFNCFRCCIASSQLIKKYINYQNRDVLGGQDSSFTKTPAISLFFYRTIKIWHTVKNTNYFLSATSKKFTVFTPYLLIVIFIILVTNIKKN